MSEATESLLKAKVAAPLCGRSLPAFYKAVAAGRLPAPLYPAPRAPRWRLSELNEAINATRALPSEAKARRRAARLAVTQQAA